MKIRFGLILSNLLDVQRVKRMVYRFCLCLLMLSVQCLSACSTANTLPAFKQMENYSFNPSTVLTDRLAEVPPVLLEALKQLDNRQDYLPYELTQAEKLQLGAALNDLPEVHRTAMDKRLVGIYFVKNLSSGGYSDFVWDRDGTLYTLLVLNPDLLHKTISDWIMEKELSAFLADQKNINLKVDCGENERSALLYLLLHESAHQLDYVAGCTPFVEKELAVSGREVLQIPFVAASWQSYDHPLPIFDFHLREKMHFYGNDSSKKLSRSTLPELYRKLEKTPFNILYASQNWAEDFAETAAFLALANITGKACTIEIEGPGNSSFQFSVLERPSVVARIPLLYSSCHTEFSH